VKHILWLFVCFWACSSSKVTLPDALRHVAKEDRLAVDFDPEKFEQTLEIIKNKIDEYHTPPKGSSVDCESFRNIRFQSNFRIEDALIIDDHLLIYLFHMGGSNDACTSDIKMYWNGKIDRDEDGKPATNLVLSFRNTTARHVGIYRQVDFDLSVIPLTQGESVRVIIYGYDGVLNFTKTVVNEPPQSHR
jgi:hypothetical protein